MYFNVTYNDDYYDAINRDDVINGHSWVQTGIQF